MADEYPAEWDKLSYGTRESKKYGLRYLGNFLENPVIKKSGLAELIRTSAENVYWTTFTDDSGYVDDGLKLMALKKYWPEKKEAIKMCLDFFYGTNWIVSLHVHDLAKEVGLEKDYPLGRL
jgi:hypothetical protein